MTFTPYHLPQLLFDTGFSYSFTIMTTLQPIDEAGYEASINTPSSDNNEYLTDQNKSLIDEVFNIFQQGNNRWQDDKIILRDINIWLSNKRIDPSIVFQLLFTQRNDLKYATLIGFCYYWGFGPTRDYAKAFEYYKIAAEHGDPLGMNELAVCYHEGCGVGQ